MRKGSQSKKARVICADSETSADMLYATGIMLPDPFVWFATDDLTVLIVSALEVGRCRRQFGSEVNVWTSREACEHLHLPTSPMASREQIISTLVQQQGVNTVEVPDDFPFGSAQKLFQEGIQPEPISPFFPERSRKRTQEIAHIRDAVRIAEQGMNRAVTVLKQAEATPDGTLYWQGEQLCSETIQGEINAEIARCGGTAAHTIVACGKQAAYPHEEGNGALRAGVPIVIDIFPCSNHTGYYGDLTRTFVKGPPSREIQQVYDTVYEAKTLAQEEIHAGAPLTSPHEKAVSVFSDKGYETSFPSQQAPYGFIHGLGHGVGLELHEAPRVSKSAEGTFEKSNVVTVEPGLYYPGWGGVRIEDVVVVTGQGYECLTEIPVFLEIP